ncbi:MAG TPA: M6 family metalloprotease domain-containing protein [Gemmatimonadales bacterium]|nr:M6 family metalloprotease domain-containing protein [Gemmatimonadales bacterium]
MRRPPILPVAAAALLAVATLAPGTLAAQNQPVRDWEPKGFDFTPNGVWRNKAKRVLAARAAAMARADFLSLNRPLSLAGPAPTSLAVTGVLRIPVLLVRYKDTPDSALYAPSTYDSVLLGATPPAGRPYTVYTFYQEISGGMLKVQGVVIGWITLDSANAWYAGPGSCDGLGSCGHVAALIRQAVLHADSTGLDWGQFDNDGPDGIPNSGDDDGFVDLVWLIHPTPGAECRINGDIWSHRYYYSGWTGVPLATSTPAKGGGTILVDNYTIQSGVGGITGCDPTQIMAPGTIGHETGHGLFLPDLYDTSLETEGIGEWGLMGSGNWSRPYSPSHMESFSLSQLGWVTVRQLTTSGTYRLGPIETGDTTFLVRPTVANPRGEYFLIENREALLSDTALIEKHGGGGLLIWHVDSAQFVNNTLPYNYVNVGSIHGVALEQADGLGNLDCTYPAACDNRGDAGDPYPGDSDRTVFGPRTHPAPAMNSTGGFPGFELDSIRQAVPNGEMDFRLRFGSLSTIRGSDTSVYVRVRGTAYHSYQDLFGDGDTVTVSADSVQQTPDGRATFLYRSWSDGGARSHVATGSSAGGTFTALMAAAYLLKDSVAGVGSITSTVAIGASGSMLAGGDSVALTAVPGSGQAFVGWTGDTTASATVLVLHVARPYAVTANFAATNDVVNQLLTGTSGLTAAQLQTLDQLGNNNGRFDLGDFVAWLDRNPGALSAAAVARVLAGARP